MSISLVCEEQIRRCDSNDHDAWTRSKIPVLCYEGDETDEAMVNDPTRKSDRLVEADLLRCV